MSLEERLQEEIAAMEPELIAIRRQFHLHPELGEAEETTSRMIRDYLEKWEIPYQYPVAGNGIVAPALRGKGRRRRQYCGSPGGYRCPAPH